MGRRRFATTGRTPKKQFSLGLEPALGQFPRGRCSRITRSNAFCVSVPKKSCSRVYRSGTNVIAESDVRGMACIGARPLLPFPCTSLNASRRAFASTRAVAHRQFPDNCFGAFRKAGFIVVCMGDHQLFERCPEFRVSAPFLLHYSRPKFFHNACFSFASAPLLSPRFVVGPFGQFWFGQAAFGIVVEFHAPTARTHHWPGEGWLGCGGLHDSTSEEPDRRQNHWIRPCESWRPETENLRQAFRSLAFHLLMRYPVPGFMDSVWDLAAGPGGFRQQSWTFASGGEPASAP